MPPIGLLLGGVDFKDLASLGGTAQEAVTMNVGTFLNNVIGFLIVAVLFLLVKMVNQLRRFATETPETPPAPPPVRGLPQGNPRRPGEEVAPRGSLELTSGRSGRERPPPPAKACLRHDAGRGRGWGI